MKVFFGCALACRVLCVWFAMRMRKLEHNDMFGRAATVSGQARERQSESIGYNPVAAGRASPCGVCKKRCQKCTEHLNLCNKANQSYFPYKVITAGKLHDRACDVKKIKRIMKKIILSGDSVKVITRYTGFTRLFFPTFWTISPLKSNKSALVV